MKRHQTLLGILIPIFSILCASTVWSAGPVQLTGKNLPQAVGQSTNTLKVLKKNSQGVIEAIPYQIDERVSPGTIGKRPFSVERGASKSDGIFDADEVLLFYSSDAGSRAGLEDFAQANKVWEVAVAPEAYVYVVAGPTTSGGSNRQYLQYDSAQDRITSSFYEIGFSQQFPLIQDYLKIKNGSVPYDVLDRFKTRFYLDIKNFFNMKINEEEIKSNLVGVKVGPIRVLRRVSAAKSLGPIKVIPRSSIDFIFYPDWVEVFTEINNPIDGPKVLHDKTVGKSGFDFNQVVFGSDLNTNLGGVSLRLDGKNGGVLKKISGESLRWWSLQGLAGSMVNLIQNDPQLKRLGIHPYLIISNDPNVSAPPESEPGEVFVGFDMPYHLIPKGSYRVKVIQVFPAQFRHGQEEAYLNGARVQTPQQVNVLK